MQRLSEQPAPKPDRHSRSPVARAELGVAVRKVRLHRAGAHHERFGDGGRGQPVGGELQHLALAWGEDGQRDPVRRPDAAPARANAWIIRAQGGKSMECIDDIGVELASAAVEHDLPRFGAREARAVDALPAETVETSATAAIRASSAISSPLSLRGYPLPFQRSWCAHAMLAPVCSTSDREPARIRYPGRAWCCVRARCA